MSRLSYCLIAIDTLWIASEQMQLSRQTDPWAGTERPSQKILQMTMLQLQFALFCLLFILLIRLNHEKSWTLLLYTVCTPPFQGVMNTHFQRGWKKLCRVQTEVAFSCRHTFGTNWGISRGQKCCAAVASRIIFLFPLLSLFFSVFFFLFGFCFLFSWNK